MNIKNDFTDIFVNIFYISSLMNIKLNYKLKANNEYKYINLTL